MSNSTASGTVYAVSTTGADIEGFDPAHDKLDLGGVSVHNFIVVDTSTGVGFMNPWTGDTIIVKGVSLGQLTVDSFLPVENAHLRECLSGALAWEQGVTPAAHTVYARCHEMGQIDRVAFDPETDVVDFRYYGSREQITMTDGAEGVVISNTGTGQSLILLGVTKAELTLDNFIFYHSEVREDRVHLQLGFGPVPDDRIVAQGVPVAGTTDWPTHIGLGDPPSGISGEVFTISWHYGSATVLHFDPAVDTLDFGWFKASEFALSETGGDTVITIVGNHQTYTLSGVSLGELSMSNITALAPDARAEWQTVLDAAAANTPTLSIANAALTEGDTGTSMLSLVVRLSAATDHDVSVDFTTANGLATAGVDYRAQVGSLVIAAGQTQAVIKVPVINDRLVELTETFRVILSGASGARLGNSVATATIRDNDIDANAGDPPEIRIGNRTMAEGDDSMGHLHLAVTLSKASTETITVRYATEDRSAHAGEDYQATSGVITFAPGQTRQEIMTHISGDTTVEGDEAFRVRLGNATHATIADGFGRATIRNDDVPGLSIGNARITEGDDGYKTIRFAVTLSEPSHGTVTVDYATRNLHADAGTDYVAKTGSLTFAPGVTTKTIAVRVLGDTLAELQENFAIDLRNPHGATLIDAVGIGRIIDEDSSPMAAMTTATTTAAQTATVDYDVSQQWAGGFTAEMMVDAGADALDGWTVAFDAGFEIGNIWNAVIKSHVGTHYVIGNADYNGDVAAGGHTSFGFQAAGSTTSVNGLELNGMAEVDLPDLSVSDARVVEGNDGRTSLVFSVSLSEASAESVTVLYRTANGSAVSGSDYTKATGTLTFAAGETTKDLRVAIHGDTLQERAESLKLILSGARGAEIADGLGRGVIVNDDPAAPGAPAVSIRDVRVTEGTGATGWLSTSGNQIIDAAGHSVQISGVNWFGFEGTNMNPNGLWTRNYQDMMRQMVDEGFNTIRLPFSSDMLHSTASPGGIDFNKNPDLKGLTALQIMDKILAYAEEIGIKVILDHHRSSAGNGTSENGLWYDSAHSQSDWVADWQMLAKRYADNTAVIGADLHNEPHNGTWGGGGVRDWALAAETAGNAIGRVNPNWLIFVEGVGSYNGQNYWWGGNLMGVRDRPIDLELDNKLVYSPHDYPQTVYDQPWFSDPNYPANLGAVFDRAWGYIYREQIAPVFVGEFGTKLTTASDRQWLDTLTAYLGGDFDNNGTRDIAADDKGVSWTYWSWNPNSGDTGGILRDDWTTVNDNKLVYLTPIADDLIATGTTGGDDQHYAKFRVTLSAPATGAVTVDWHTVAGSASGADFEAASGRLRFAAGEFSKTISIAIAGDAIDERNEGFAVVLGNPLGVSVADRRGNAIIVDDDGASVAARSAVAASEAGNEVWQMTGDLSATIKAAEHASPGADDFVFALSSVPDAGQAMVLFTGIAAIDTLALDQLL